MSLYQISAEIQSVLDAMLEGGVDDAAAQAALDEHLTGLDAALESKADRMAGIIRELEVRAAARSDEARRIRTLAATDEALAGRLKERLKAAMETSGKLRIDTPNFRLSVAGVGGRQSMEVIPEQVPATFTITRVEPDKERIRAALEAGEMVPGCALLPRGTSLRIK